MKKKEEIKHVANEPVPTYARNKPDVSLSSTDFEIHVSMNEYVTSDEFRRVGLEKLNHICKEHGLL